MQRGNPMQLRSSPVVGTTAYVLLYNSQLMGGSNLMNGMAINLNNLNPDIGPMEDDQDFMVLEKNIQNLIQ